MKNSCLLLKKKSCQSCKDHECELHHRWDLCSMLTNVKGLVSWCYCQGPQYQKRLKIAITFSTTTILYAINQLTSLESPRLSYWDPKWTRTSWVQNSTLPLARVSQTDFLSLWGARVPLPRDCSCFYDGCLLNHVNGQAVLCHTRAHTSVTC